MLATLALMRLRQGQEFEIGLRYIVRHRLREKKLYIQNIE